MYKINDYIIYRRDVCHIKDIKEKNNLFYYVLEPINDHSLAITIPVEQNSELIRDLITKEEIEKIIEGIPNISTIDIPNEKLIEQEYKKLLMSGSHLDLIKIIKTTFERNENRLKNKRKISEKDDTYFRSAEKQLYTEFSVVLGLSYDETRNYVIENVKKTIK